MDGLALATVFTTNAKKILSGWDYPVLLIRSSKGRPHARSMFDTPDPHTSSQDTSQSSADQLDHYLDPESVVLPICKSDRNAFSHMITIGRAANNDICLGDNTLSKVHGWFLPPDKSGMWHYIDNGSTNGTKINKHKIITREAVHIKYSDEMVMGNIQMLFLSKDNVFDLIDYMHGEDKKTRRVSRAP